MIPGNIPMGRLYRIPVFVHISLPIVAIVAALAYRDLVVVPMIAILAFCILLHEIGHSVVAMRKDCDVRQIILTPIGGVAQIASAQPLAPKDEVQVAIAGPLVSLTLAAGLGVLGTITLLTGMPMIPIYLIAIAVANMVFFLFNLLPAFPMDGGRVLRACLTPSRGRLEATRIAMNVGRIFAGGFFLFGLLKPDIKMMLIAFFIYFTAGYEYRSIKAHDFFRGPLNEGPKEQDGLIVGPAPYESAREAEKRNFGVWRETRSAARILLEEFSRMHKV